MVADQRNSNTRRNRKLYQMRLEVLERHQAALLKAKVTKLERDFLDLGKLNVVLHELLAIRRDLKAKAPYDWQDLMPEPSAALVQRGIALVKEDIKRGAVQLNRARTKAEIRNGAPDTVTEETMAWLQELGAVVSSDEQQ